MRLLFLFLLVLVVLVSGCTKVTDCGSNIECFKNNAKTCSKSKFLIPQEGSEILITLRGIHKENCGISFKIINVGDKIKESYPLAPELKGKTLNCFVPFRNIGLKDWVKFILVDTQFDAYCLGQVKDIAKGPLEDIIKKKLQEVST